MRRLFKVKNKLIRLLFVIPVFLLIILISCSGDDKKELLDQKLTDNKPIAAPVKSETREISEGNKYFLSGDFTEAIRYYEKGLAENRSVAFYNIGVSYYLLDDVKSSEIYFRKAVEEDPNFKEAVINLAVTLIQTGQLDEAEKFISKLLKDEQSAKLLVNMANLYLTRGETAKAVLYYNEALTKGDKSKFVMSNYAYFLLAIGETQEAIDILEGLEYKDYSDYYNIGLGYYTLANYYNASQNLISALNLKTTEEALDLLAKTYNATKNYFNEAMTLGRLIVINPKEEYKLRHAKALYRNADFTEAKDAAKELVILDPKNHEYTFLYYDILLALEEFDEAGTFAEEKFNAYKTNELMYLYIKHILTYKNKADEAQKIIFEWKDSGYTNLAKTAFYIATDKMVPAGQSLDLVPQGLHNDYYVFYSYILMKYRQFAKAMIYTAQIEEVRPEYFWYKTVNLVNMKNISGLKAHFRKYVDNKSTKVRRPDLSVHIKPVSEDMPFAYKFDETGTDYASTLMYPLFIEPDEMLTFLTLGYKLLQQDDKLVALQELQKSIKFSDGIKANNRGVKLFLEFKYTEALKEFDDANQLLNNNPFTLFNMGLAQMNLGLLDDSLKSFDMAILHNRYHFPAYVGKGIVHSKLNNKKDAEGSLKYVSVTSEKVDLVEDNIPEPVYLYKYLANIALDDFDTVASELKDSKTKDGVTTALKSLSNFVSLEDSQSLLDMANSGAFHAKALFDLIKISSSQISGEYQTPKEDRYKQLTSLYIMQKKNPDFVVIDDSIYEQDKVVYKELLYHLILQQKPREGLEMLKKLNKLDLFNIELHKAALYFFTWLEDFVNAEAAFTALETMGTKDIYSDYYRLLYFLVNYNGERLETRLNDYNKEYQDDYRGLGVNILYALKNNDITLAYNHLVDVDNKFGNFLLKMPLELEIDGL